MLLLISWTAPVRLDAFGVKGLTRLINEIAMLREAYGNAIVAEQVILATHFAHNFLASSGCTKRFRLIKKSSASLDFAF